METLTLEARPLTAAAFAPYGDVIEMRSETPESMNQGWGERHNDLAQVDIDDQNGAVKISLVHMRPEATPVPLRLLERHPLGSQIFMPLGPNPYLVVVAPAGPHPDRSQLEAFLCTGNQGVNYHKGVWHHPMIALDGNSNFLTVDRKGPGNNCDEIDIPGGPVEVQTTKR